MLGTHLTLPDRRRPLPTDGKARLAAKGWDGPPVGPPTGYLAARFVAVFCGLFLAGLMLIELHFTASAQDLRSGRQFVASGDTSIALYGAGRRGHCFVNDAYRAVPQGRLTPGGIGPTRMLRVPADGAPKRIQCSGQVRVIESRLVPLYTLIDSDRPLILGAIGLLAGTYLGWPLWLWRPSRVNRG